MELIVEDGSGVVGANSYVSRPYSDDYFENHPFYSDNWNEIEVYKKEGLLVAASQQLDVLFNWYGFRTYNQQELSWPRQRVWYGPIRDYVSYSTIPKQVKQATCEMAYFMSKGDVFAPSSSASLDSLKIDVIELNFSNSTNRAPVAPAALALLNGLGDYAFGGRVRKVVVG